MNAATWHGRRGTVLLGPTEDRVARHLYRQTRHGRITLRTVDLAARLRLERSEAYRILARLRVLGLFGIENDKGGNKGGRHIWRTAIEHDGAGLDPDRHHTAWSRIVGSARARSLRVAVRLAAIRATYDNAAGAGVTPRATATPGHDGGTPSSPGGTFAERMRRYGLGELMDGWGVGSPDRTPVR